MAFAVIDKLRKAIVLVFDASRIFQKDMGCFGAFRLAIQDPESSWTSVYDSNKNTWRGNLTSLIAKIG